jgi:RNA polymerase sigma-70 factor (ECF subfamily)
MEEIILNGVQQLPRQQKLAFYLSRYEGLRHDEIAVQMGITKESVKSHVVRAISTLRKYVASRLAQIVLFITCLL